MITNAYLFQYLPLHPIWKTYWDSVTDGNIMNNDMKQLSDEKDNSNSPAYDTAQVITQGQDG